MAEAAVVESRLAAAAAEEEAVELIRLRRPRNLLPTRLVPVSARLSASLTVSSGLTDRTNIDSLLQHHLRIA